MSETTTKPPLGAIPRWLWREQRMAHLTEAIERFRAAGHEPRPEWCAELLELWATREERP